MGKITPILSIFRLWTNTGKQEKEWPKKPCQDKMHNPPMHMVFHEGDVWTCPTCGNKITIHVPTFEW